MSALIYSIAVISFILLALAIRLLFNSLQDGAKEFEDILDNEIYRRIAEKICNKVDADYNNITFNHETDDFIYMVRASVQIEHENECGGQDEYGCVEELKSVKDASVYVVCYALDENDNKHHVDCSAIEELVMDYLIH